MMLAVVLLGAAVLMTGCAARVSKAAAPPPSVVGLWTIESAKGKAASLSEIGFDGNGTFKHMGHNALGKPVTFQGVYQVGGSDQGPVIRLTYDDFPDQPTRWYFRLDGSGLVVAENAADLDTERALEFERAQEQ